MGVLIDGEAFDKEHECNPPVPANAGSIYWCECGKKYKCDNGAVKFPAMETQWRRSRWMNFGPPKPVPPSSGHHIMKPLASLPTMPKPPAPPPPGYTLNRTWHPGGLVGSYIFDQDTGTPIRFADTLPDPLHRTVPSGQSTSDGLPSIQEGEGSLWIELIKGAEITSVTHLTTDPYKINLCFNKEGSKSVLIGIEIIRKGDDDNAANES